MPRIHNASMRKEDSSVRGWIRKNTRIGPVLDVKVCRHEDRYSMEVLIEFLFQDPHSLLDSNRDRN